jgi:hypothetical protein
MPEHDLNVASTSDEEIGRDLSNFGDFPFYYGKRPIRYRSVESFYQALTQSDEKLRKTIAKLTGKEAKRAGNSQSSETKFDGTTYCTGIARASRLGPRCDSRTAEAESRPDGAIRGHASASPGSHHGRRR